MIFRKAPIAFGSLLAVGLNFGCTTPPDTPALSENFDAEYSKLAACSFSELDRQYPTKIKFTDLRGINAARITHESETGGILGSDTIRLWEASFTKLTEQRTKVEIKAMGTIYGADYYAKQILPHIASCAAPAAPRVR